MEIIDRISRNGLHSLYVLCFVKSNSKYTEICHNASSKAGFVTASFLCIIILLSIQHSSSSITATGNFYDEGPSGHHLERDSTKHRRSRNGCFTCRSRRVKVICHRPIFVLQTQVRLMIANMWIFSATKQDQYATVSSFWYNEILDGTDATRQDVKRASVNVCIPPNQHELANHHQPSHHQIISWQLPKVPNHRKLSRNAHHHQYMVTSRVWLCINLAFHRQRHW